MIVRRYGRRTRCAGRSFSDAALVDGGTEMDEPLSLSQETSTSQPDPYGFAAFSSQDSSPWSLDSDIFGPNEFAAAPVLPPLPPPPRPGGNSSNVTQSSRDRKNMKIKKPELPAPGSSSSLPRPTAPSSATATLMEAQEFGEMMEHVDEVNFALDGLRPGQPARIRQASLLSLLTICATAQQRRFLRAQGMSKRIIDAVLDLSLDDSASSLAAAALFYVLASDVPDDCLLDSPSCINFLLQLLRPPVAASVHDKVPGIGCRILGISNAIALKCSDKKLDSNSTLISSKVQEILLGCKELKPSSRDDDPTGRPELNPKWIALLTLEKTCLSTVSIEDTSGTVSRVGGNFKERLRELGGLDAIFDVAASCYSVMEGSLKDDFSSFMEFKNVDLQSMVLLLKCFKIMENATFLSKDNQDHLLGMRKKVDKEVLPLSFVRLVLSAIKVFSGLSLHQTYPCIPMKQPSCLLKDDRCWISSAESGDSGSAYYTKRSDSCQKRQRLLSTEFEFSIAGSETTVACDSNISCSLAKTDPYPPISCNGKFDGSTGEIAINAEVSNVNPTRSSNGLISIHIHKSKGGSVNGSTDHFNINSNELKGTFPSGSNAGFSMGSKMSSVHLRKRPRPTVGSKDECIGIDAPFTFDVDDGDGAKLNFVHLEERLNTSEETEEKCIISAHDPFAFDEDDLGPSKWEMLARRKETSETRFKGSAGSGRDRPPRVRFGRPDSIHGLRPRADPARPQANPSGLRSTPNDPDPDPDLDQFEPSQSNPDSQSLEPLSEKSRSMIVYGELENGQELLSSNPESSKEENINSNYCRPSAAEEDIDLLEDCLLTAVKVLMNLTNDNPVGCQQIAACGGLDTLASLISSHFPSFDFQPVHSQLDESISVSKSSADAGPMNNKFLNDRDLDFLVAILGLLVNLVEKDILNRSRLASASVSMVHSGGKSSHRDLISLLCSIFLANQGAGEVAGEGRLLPGDDEIALLQGEREAEMMIIEAYAALLLAFLSTESKKSREAIANYLPDNNLEVLVPVLERFVAFHVSLSMISAETHSVVTEVIESCKGS